MKLFANVGRRRRARKAGVFALLLAASAAGCSDYLSTEPRGELTSENFFETATQAVQATNATYNMLRAWPVHVFAWIGMTDIAADDATKGSTPGDASFLLDLDNLNFDPGNIAFLDTWTGYYQGIYRANVALQSIPAVEMDPGLKARLLAENQFLRAYFYFFLVRAYGGVPLVTAPLRPGEFTQPRASAEEVYALIEQDLLAAIAALPENAQYGAADQGRASKGAARALLAEVYLYRKDYGNALKYAEEVINSGQYQLFPSYGTLFSAEGENSSESVFEVRAAALEEGGAGSQYAQVQGVRGTPNIGWGFNMPSPDLEASYEPGDPRLEATILYPWELLPDGTGRVVYFSPSMQNNRYNQKVFTSPETPRGSGNSGINIRRIRYSDVLLIAAEAAQQTGNAAAAQDYLNQVRRRARGGQDVTLGFSAEPLAESIATDVLELAPGTSRVFVRYVSAGSGAYAAGLRSFTSECADKACKSSAIPPVGVTSIDLIQSVNGTPITTLESYLSAVAQQAPGAAVPVQVLRISQAAGTTNTSTLNLSVPVERLLPDVTASGQALLDAIWHERRVELAMEQQRWFDIVRQGRAAQVMAQAGKTFVTGKDELYPIPASEVQISGLQQNPGY